MSLMDGGSILLEMGKMLVDFQKEYKAQKLKDLKLKSEAIVTLQTAIMASRKHIETKGYTPNDDLTLLWHEAFNKISSAGISNNLPKYLYQKAKFWNSPKEWIDNPSSLELVPKLALLEEECYSILNDINK